MSLQCFCIFEGGGAKGITHLGALKAMENVGLARIGAAGTSAGAIVAALTAVGYKADELFDPKDGDVLTRLGKTPLDLLGAADWTQFRALRLPRAVAAICALLPLVVSFVAFAAARLSGRPRIFSAAWRLVDGFGFFRTDNARDILNEILRAKLSEVMTVVPPLVRFRDIAPTSTNGCCTLKIIATNIDTGAMVVFGQDDPDIVVADAVAASFSIPLFFRPTMVRRVDDKGRGTPPPPNSKIKETDRFVDGGLVSNLPVWVFSEDKRSVERASGNQTQPPIPIIGFTLVDPAKPARSASPSRPPLLARFDPLTNFIVKVGHTAVFGGQSIVEDFVPNLTVVKLPAQLGVLAFDCTRDEANVAYESGRLAANDTLGDVFQVRPQAQQNLLRDLDQQIAARSAQLRSPAGAPRFRLSLVAPRGNRSFQVVAALNMDTDADDNLILDEKNPGAPRAFLTKRITFLDVRSQSSSALCMTKYERALMRRTLASVISIPIFASIEEWAKEPEQRSVPRGVLCIDSDDDLGLEYRDSAARQIMAIGGVACADFLGG